MSGADNLATLNAIEKVLNKRWPESKIEPTLDRILALTDALGSPQFSYPTIHLAGTNGKKTTARMIDRYLVTICNRHVTVVLQPLRNGCVGPVSG